jgi:hypothetical protein
MVISVEGTNKIHMEPGQESMVYSPVLLIFSPTGELEHCCEEETNSFFFFILGAFLSNRTLKAWSQLMTQ